MRSRPMPVSIDGLGSGVIAPLASRLNCMNTRFQISSQRPHSQEGSQSGLGQPVLLSPVVVDLGAGTAGARVAHRPEVVGLVEARDAMRGHADLVAPDALGLVVLAEHGDGEPLGRDLVALREQLPRPGDRLAT